MSLARDSGDEARYELTLFVSGASERSARAVRDATAFCDLRLTDRYRLTVVDLYEEPPDALARSVLVAPALVRERPLPVRRIVGDLSNPQTVSSVLGLPSPGDAAGAPG